MPLSDKILSMWEKSSIEKINTWKLPPIHLGISRVDQSEKLQDLVTWPEFWPGGFAATNEEWNSTIPKAVFEFHPPTTVVCVDISLAVDTNIGLWLFTNKCCSVRKNTATLFGAKHEQNNLSKTFDEGTGTKKGLLRSIYLYLCMRRLHHHPVWYILVFLCIVFCVIWSSIFRNYGHFWKFLLKHS